MSISYADCFILQDGFCNQVYNFKKNEWQTNIDWDCVKSTEPEIWSSFFGFRSEDLVVLPYSTNILRYREERRKI